MLLIRVRCVYVLSYPTVQYVRIQCMKTVPANVSYLLTFTLNNLQINWGLLLKHILKNNNIDTKQVLLLLVCLKCLCDTQLNTTFYWLSFSRVQEYCIFSLWGTGAPALCSFWVPAGNSPAIVWLPEEAEVANPGALTLASCHTKCLGKLCVDSIRNAKKKNLKVWSPPGLWESLQIIKLLGETM